MGSFFFLVIVYESTVLNIWIAQLQKKKTVVFLRSSAHKGLIHSVKICHQLLLVCRRNYIAQ